MNNNTTNFHIHDEHFFKHEKHTVHFLGIHVKTFQKQNEYFLKHGYYFLNIPVNIFYKYTMNNFKMHNDPFRKAGLIIFIHDAQFFQIHNIFLKIIL